ncbi:MAG: protein kinase [Proteobacteria bacterium]|nr:protein kinase [Pseudomonadota bacterium]
MSDPLKDLSDNLNSIFDDDAAQKASSPDDAPAKSNTDAAGTPEPSAEPNADSAIAPPAFDDEEERTKVGISAFGDDDEEDMTSAMPRISISATLSQPSCIKPEFDDTEISQNYRVGKQIGRGGCAVVYEAWRLTDNMHVVIKVLQPSGGLDEKETHVAIARFYREAELISSLEEQHIVKCVDYGKYQGIPCMCLEFVDGLSLDQLLAKNGPIPLKFATGIIEQLLSALVETHAKKIIHRDIKPGNIMIFDSPPPYEIRVLDFGISSVADGLQSQTLMTQQGNVRGTPSYMAPELFTGETHASVESDLYAVGLVYLECLTGEIAVNDKSFMRVAYKQVQEQLEVPGFIPKCIADIILKLCAKKADDRYHSAQCVLDDIHEHLDEALAEEDKCIQEWEKSNHKAVYKSKYAGNQVTQNWRRVFTNPKFIALAVGTFLLLVGLAVIIAFSISDSNDEDLEQQAAIIEAQKQQVLEKEKALQDQAKQAEEIAKQAEEIAKQAKEKEKSRSLQYSLKITTEAFANTYKSTASRIDQKIRSSEKKKTTGKKNTSSPTQNTGKDQRARDVAPPIPF